MLIKSQEVLIMQIGEIIRKYRKERDLTQEEMLASIGEITDFRKSPLYEHMEFKETREEFLTELRENLLACFCDEETYGFLKENKRWQELVKRD
jgi:transcriptional regulator with XRE-family HTH domain